MLPCRGGGTRTPNRRFWRPVLCQVELRPSDGTGPARKAGTRLPSIGRPARARQRMSLLRFPQVTPDIRPVEARRPQALEAGLFMLVVALPLAFFPQSRSAFLDVKILVLATGALLVWASGLPADRRLALPALVWAAVIAVAALAGADPVESLIPPELPRDPAVDPRPAAGVPQRRSDGSRRRTGHHDRPLGAASEFAGCA